MTRRWTGGASVRLRSAGMLNVPKPFATLTLDDGRRGAGRAADGLHAQAARLPVAAAAEDAAEVFPVRATGFKRGVGFARPGERPYYFWCGRAQERVLAALEEAGFVVDPSRNAARSTAEGPRTTQKAPTPEGTTPEARKRGVSCRRRRPWPSRTSCWRPGWRG